METNAKRTLVKSAPELWVLADDPERLGSWMSDLLGIQRPLAVEVTERDHERLLRWRAATPDADAQIRLELADSGFGTVVEIAASHSRRDPEAANSALEGVLDELGSPERRPFAAT